MDKLMCKENLNLKLKPYKALATGATHGFIQVTHLFSPTFKKRRNDQSWNISYWLVLLALNLRQAQLIVEPILNHINNSLPQFVESVPVAHVTQTEGNILSFFKKNSRDKLVILTNLKHFPLNIFLFVVFPKLIFLFWHWNAILFLFKIAQFVHISVILQECGRARYNGHLYKELCRILCYNLPSGYRGQTSGQSYVDQTGKFLMLTKQASFSWEKLESLRCVRLSISSFAHQSTDFNFKFYNITNPYPPGTSVPYWLWLHLRAGPQTLPSTYETVKGNGKTKYILQVNIV